MSTVDRQPTGGVADVDHLTARVIEIWTAVLDQPGVTPDSNFLELGANSMAAVRLRSRVRAELGKEIELVDLLDHVTPREQAELIAAAPDWTGSEAWHQLDWTVDDESAEAPDAGR